MLLVNLTTKISPGDKKIQAWKQLMGQKKNNNKVHKKTDVCFCVFFSCYDQNLVFEGRRRFRFCLKLILEFCWYFLPLQDPKPLDAWQYVKVLEYEIYYTRNQVPLYL